MEKLASECRALHSLSLLFGFLADRECFIVHRYVATLRGHVAPVYRLAWSADSRLLVSASKDSTVKVFCILAHCIWKFTHYLMVKDMESQDVQVAHRSARTYR